MTTSTAGLAVDPSRDPLVVVIVGAGPAGTGVLERLTANAAELLPGQNLVVHLVDPYPPGAGRVWRHEQSALLRMNSMAEDVTMFTDESVVCEGPVIPGPSLIEWAGLVDSSDLADAEVAAEVASLTGRTFPTRRLQAAYLAWTFRRIVDDAPEGVVVVVHQARGNDVRDRDDGRQEVVLDDGTIVEADAVVLALGHVEAAPDALSAAHAAFAHRHRLLHLPPAYTADEDLSPIPPGADVIVSGLGLAFIDLVVLLTEGRGGRYVPREGGGLDYLPSGREPRLLAGSRRGVPYRSKLGQVLQGDPPQPPRFLTAAAVDALLDSEAPLEFRRDVYPLVAKEVAWGYYRELFTGHPDRVTRPWSDFAEAFAAADHDSADLVDLVAAAVPSPEDRLDLGRLDRPLQGIRFEDPDDLQRFVTETIEANLSRAHDQSHSADLGAFGALLSCFGQLPRIIGSGRLTPRDRIEQVDGWFFGFFSYLASGPPGHRLEELLALSRAGVLRFLGADLTVEGDDATGRFVARTSSSPEVTTASVFVEARLPAPHLARTHDRLLQALFERGEGGEDVLVDPADGAVYPTGLLDVEAPDLRVRTATGEAHRRRFAVGAPTNKRLAGTFSRPRTNAVAFRQMDALARSLLRAVAPATSRGRP